MSYIGEIAGLGAAACWSVTSLLFTFVVQRLGAFSLNVLRLSLATVLLGSLALALHGAEWFRTARPADLWLLCFSGWIGLTLGDWAYFRALGLLGARLATLMMALAPPITALLSIPLLRERLSFLGWAGMALTLAGVGWVVLERPADVIPRGHRIAGVLLGVLGSFGQALGYILSKAGMAGGIGPLPATAIRMAAGGAGIWLLVLLTRRPTGMGRLRADSRLAWAVAGATILGPVTGVWLSLVAVRATQTGVAATLIATVPVLVLPLVVIVHKEKVSLRAVLGAILAVAGVAVLFLRK